MYFSPLLGCNWVYFNIIVLLNFLPTHKMFYFIQIGRWKHRDTSRVAACVSGKRSVWMKYEVSTITFNNL